jgi:hypothetical protein
VDESEDEEDDVMDDEEEEEGDIEEEEEEEDGYDPGLDGVGTARSKAVFEVSGRSSAFGLRDPGLFDSFRDTKRSRFGESTWTDAGNGSQAAPVRQTKYDLLAVAKGTVSRPQRELLEPDEMILETEKLLGRLSESVSSDNPMQRSETIADVAQQLLRLWRQYSGSSSSFKASLTGPPVLEGWVSKANYLVSLLLQLYYPAVPSIPGRSSMFAMSRRGAQQNMPMPKVLLDWMNGYHRPESEIGTVLREQRGYSASPAYWDAVKYSVSASLTISLIILLTSQSGPPWKLCSNSEAPERRKIRCRRNSTHRRVRGPGI